MIPAGYMAKRVSKRPDWLRVPHVSDIYSVSGCVCEDFANYIGYWKHNGFWFFDSPEVIRTVAQENSIDLKETVLFYYEAHEFEFDGESWHAFGPEPSIPTNVAAPSARQLEGFDVATFSNRNAPECSPLSCNRLAEELETNSHCLFASFEEAEMSLKNGSFNDSEPGPYRIFSVYSVDWPWPHSSGLIG
jgi:hypothetical protein